jgi:hypothetical protein
MAAYLAAGHASKHVGAEQVQDGGVVGDWVRARMWLGQAYNYSSGRMESELHDDARVIP